MNESPLDPYRARRSGKVFIAMMAIVLGLLAAAALIGWYIGAWDNPYFGPAISE